MYYYFIRAAILFIICLDLDKLFLLQGHWPQLLWSLRLSHVLLNHQSLVVMNKVQSNVLSMEALLTTLPHLMKSKRVFLFLLLIFQYFNILPSVYCIVNCMHTSTSLVYLGACQNTNSFMTTVMTVAFISFHFCLQFQFEIELFTFYWRWGVSRGVRRQFFWNCEVWNKIKVHFE